MVIWVSQSQMLSFPWYICLRISFQIVPIVLFHLILFICFNQSHQYHSFYEYVYLHLNNFQHVYYNYYIYIYCLFFIIIFFHYFVTNRQIKVYVNQGLTSHFQIEKSLTNSLHKVIIASITAFNLYLKTHKNIIKQN